MADETGLMAGAVAESGASPITLDQLLARQQEMVALAAEAGAERDPERLQSIAGRLKKMGDELQAEAQRFITRTPTAWTEVVLTEPQRERVFDATGHRLESVVLRDEGGATTRTMPGTDPRIIEHYAMQEGRRRQITAESEALLRAQLDESLAAIERQGTPALLDELDKLKRDPNFLGGLLQKK